MLRNRRGTASLEFVLVAVPFLTVMFCIFDLGRYAITAYSLKTLASAGARAVMVNCYSPNVIANQSPSTCTGDPLTDSAKQSAAPMLFTADGSKPTLAVANGASQLIVTASQPNFAMMMPIWGTSLNAPSVSTAIPY